MRPLKFSLNVTLDGCYDHTLGLSGHRAPRHGIDRLVPDLCAAPDQYVPGQARLAKLNAGGECPAQLARFEAGRLIVRIGFT